MFEALINQNFLHSLTYQTIYVNLPWVHDRNTCLRYMYLLSFCWFLCFCVDSIWYRVARGYSRIWHETWDGCVFKGCLEFYRQRSTGATTLPKATRQIFHNLTNENSGGERHFLNTLLKSSFFSLQRQKIHGRFDF